MIRTTISRIKRVWAITFSPRLLRGDLRYPPGKFQIPTSTAPTSPLIRSKSTGSIYDDHGKRQKYGSVGKHDGYLSQDMPAHENLHGAPPLYQKTSACRCDECNKIIAEIFGEEVSDQNERSIKTKVLSNIAQVNMTDNTGPEKPVSDSRIQAGIFNVFNKENNDPPAEKKRQNIDESTNITKDTYRSVLCHEVIIMKEEGSKRPELLEVDTHQMYTNLYDVDPEEYQCYAHKNVHSYDSKLKDRKVDAYWNDVYETAVGENSVYCEPTLCIDGDTLNTYKALKTGESVVKEKSFEMRNMKYSPQEIEKLLDEGPLQVGYKFNDKQGEKQQLIKATTTKQDEEEKEAVKLTQKLEVIQEPTLVEAEKSKVEGVQGTPKVLGHVEKAAELNHLDEVAKRCLTSPHNKIDEILLKEMERLGIPLTMQRSTCGLKIGDTQADTLDKPKSSMAQNKIKSDNSEFESIPSYRSFKKSNNLDECKNPLEEYALKLQHNYDFQRTKMDDNLQNGEQNKLDSSTKPNVCNESDDKKSKWLYWRSDTWPKRSGTSDQENNIKLTDNIWQKNQLDPKHVLTCNETCSISPKPLISTNDINHIEGTEVMYEQKNIYSDELVKQNPLLEDGGSDSFVTRTADYSRDRDRHIRPSENINTSKAEEYIDFINSTNSTIKATSAPAEISYTKDLSPVSVSPSELPRQECTTCQNEDIKASLDLSKDDKNEPCVMEATSERLQATSEHLQAASVQLQATCEHLQNTTEQLQVTSEKLQATTDHLLDSSDKLHAASENLYTSTEKLHYTSEKLRDSSEQLVFDMHMLINKVSTCPPQEQVWDTNIEADRADEMYLEYGKKAPQSKVEGHTDVYNSQTPSMNKPSIMPCVTPYTAAIITETVKSMYRMKELQTEKQEETKDIQDIENTKMDDDKKNDIQEMSTKTIEPKMEEWIHQATTINPTAPTTQDLPSVDPLPKLDRVKLSELMKLVRERNRLVDCHEAHVLAKPIRKDIPPMSRPMARPAPGVEMPSYPELKPIPKICVPKGRPKPKSMKYSRCNVETLGLNQQGPLIAQNESEYPTVSRNLDHQQSIDITLIEDDITTDLTEEFILQLHSLGNVVESSYKRGKAEVLEAAVLAKTNHLVKMNRSNDYEPWSPIPSWPYHKKQKRQKLQCPKDGCKIPPPRLLEDRPCGLKPCRSFPTFPKRTFSLLDCYPVSLGKHKVIDVGNF